MARHTQDDDPETADDRKRREERQARWARVTDHGQQAVIRALQPVPAGVEVDAVLLWIAGGIARFRVNVLVSAALLGERLEIRSTRIVASYFVWGRVAPGDVEIMESSPAMPAMGLAAVVGERAA